MTRAASDSPAAQALRDAGYVKMPGWWLTREQAELVAYMARQNLEDIERIKDRYRDRPHRAGF